MHDRGRAALQRRVQHPKSNRASAPVDGLRFGIATTGKGTTSVVLKPVLKKTAHARPWKSGASAPRPAPQKQPGFSPSGRFAVWNRHDREGHDFSRAQARVKEDRACSTVEERRFSAASSTPKSNRASAPVDGLRFGIATTGKDTTSVAPRAPRGKPTHAQPWKSGASAPRKAPQKQP